MKILFSSSFGLKNMHILIPLPRNMDYFVYRLRNANARGPRLYQFVPVLAAGQADMYTSTLHLNAHCEEAALPAGRTHT